MDANQSDALVEILNGFPDPVILLNQRREITAFNSSAAALFRSTELGRDLGRELGRDLALSLHHPEIIAAADEVLAGNRPEPLEVSLPLNVRRDFTLHASPLHSENGDHADGAMLVLHDVTAVSSAEQMRADFVANVSHELRSPLTSLTGFIETLQGAAKDDDEARERFLGIMEVEAGRMTRLINDLLSLSKVEAREFIQPEGEVAIGEMLTGIADALLVRASERNMEIQINADADLPLVTGDADELTTVFQNLLDNAVSYAADDSIVSVNIWAMERLPESAAAGLAVAVNNKGDAIPTELLPRLTERFFRVDKGRSRLMGGTGLGLAIVKHVVNRHRGQLALDSTPEDGTTFTVYLPS